MLSTLRFFTKNLGKTVNGKVALEASKASYCSFIPSLLQTTTRKPVVVTSRTFSCSKLLSAASGSDILASFGKEVEGNNVAAAMEALANADAVCFDVDSTVIQEEGIDVLAASLGKGEEVSAWTKKAMDGNTKFEDALAARLDIIKPSRLSIEKCLRDNPLQLTPGVDTFIETLIERGIDVYLVSGGFRIMIEPVARILCVAKSNIYANTIFFDENTPSGEYTGFCRDEPTSADMGKPKALQKIKDEHGYSKMVMIGDGATDSQARPPADAFIGFGGVIVRDAVRAKACWYVKDFDSLTEIIKKHGHNKLKK